MEDLFSVHLADRSCFNKLCGTLHRCVRIVCRKEQMICSYREQCADQRFRRAVRAGGDHNVVLDIVRGRLLQLFAVWRSSPPVVNALQNIWKRLAHMSEQHDDPGEGIEDSATDDAQGVRSGLNGPVPGGTVQSWIALIDLHLVAR